MIIRGKKAGTPGSTSTGGFRLSAGTDAIQRAEDIRLSPAQRAAMERDLAAYMELDCGHMVTREEAILFSVFARTIKDIHCDKCGEFRRLKKRKGRKEYPDHPLF